MTGLSAYPAGAGGHTRSRWVGRAAILPSFPHAPSWLRLAALTISMLGLQLVWSCEMAQASPYLLSLGVSKSHISIVLLAGPLSGLIVQPVVGVLSDNCKSSLGRRRPFIIGGCIVSSLSVMLFGWAREIAGVVTTEGGVVHARLTIALAVIAVFVIDFSINVVQAMDRSLLVDVVSPQLQPAATAWAGRMFGVGAVAGYWIGGLDLVSWTGGYLGSEQLKVLTFITAFFLCSTHAITVACVRERVLISREDLSPTVAGESPTMKALGHIWTTLRTLPRPIQQILNVQFSSWIGWFPILFFSTTWVAEIYIKTASPYSDLASAPTDVRDTATRAGTKAMLYHSMVSLVTSILLPPLVSGTAGGSKDSSPYPRSSGGFGHAEGWQEKLKSILPHLPISWLSLPLLWTLSNGLFSVLLIVTWLAKSVAAASFIIAAAGFCWSVTNWAPFALLGDLIHRLGTTTTAIALEDHHASTWATTPTPHMALSPIAEGSEYEPVDKSDMDTPKGRRKEWDGEFPSPKREQKDNGASSMTGTPPSATSAYFDASMESPGSQFHIGDDDDDARLSPRRSPSASPSHDRSRDSSSSHPYEYPPNGRDLYSSHLGDHDPYTYASTSTILAHADRNTPTVLQIRHSDDTFERDTDDDETDDGRRDSQEGDMEDNGNGKGRRGSATSMRSSRSNHEPPRVPFGGPDEDEWGEEVEGEGHEGDGSGDQAGVILGCHNIYLVLPQFLVNALSSIIFAILAPDHPVMGVGHPVPSVPAVPVVPPPDNTFLDDRLGQLARVLLLKRASVDGGEGWDALGLVFRIGGASAAVSTVICWRMWRDRERERMARRIRGTG